MERHAAAQEQAGRHLTRTRERQQLQAVRLDGDYHRATMHCPHPDDPDRTLCAAATGPGHAQAIELVRLEMRGQLIRHYLDASLSVRERDGLVYDHGTQTSTNRVADAVAEQGGDRPDAREVGIAYVAMRAVGDVTIGQVAAAVIARRQGLSVAPAIADGRAGEQSRLL